MSGGGPLGGAPIDSLKMYLIKRALGCGGAGMPRKRKLVISWCPLIRHYSNRPQEVYESETVALTNSLESFPENREAFEPGVNEPPQ